MKKKGYLAIVLGITGNWAFTAGTILIGLKHHLKIEEYDVIIYQQNLLKKDADCLMKIHPCIFNQYKFRNINVPMDKFKRVSEMAFSRFECFDLLDDYKNVIWIDVDALILKDFSNIINNLNNGIGMYPHQNTPISVSFSNSVPGYNMQAECFNSGIIFLNDSLVKRKFLSDWCYSSVEKHIKYISSDQAIINLMLQEFDIKPKEIAVKYNCPPSSETEDTVIVHPWGNRKFWNDIYHPVWEGYFQKWRKMGGSSTIVDAYFLRRAKILFKAMKRKIKKEVFK
ncbi:glycosyltransferase [Bacteroidota bacterium]